KSPELQSCPAALTSASPATPPVSTTSTPPLLPQPPDMMPCATHLLVAALVLAMALAHALPAPNTHAHNRNTPLEVPNSRLEKRAISSDSGDEEISALKDLILARVASELQDSWQDLPTLKKML
ncbi:hypothetical protein OTU49_008772, partial [Cherax quadricarinatus]